MASGHARIGVYGGTFDPPHNGHLVIAVNAASQLQLDRVLLVVANEPWQKVDGRRVTPSEDRFAMVERCVNLVDPRYGIEASRIEIDRGGPTYTADTLEQIHDDHPDAELWLVVGADVARSLHTWHRPEAVKARAGLAVVSRHGDDAPLVALEREGWRVARVDIPRLDISSKEIRRRLAADEPVDGLVPDVAIRYLRERDLYADHG